MTTLSVVIPCHNARGTLGACLEALRAQTQKPSEVIVVNDASTDGSDEIAARFGVAVIRSDKRRSAGQARNVGKAHAGGDIIAFTDADALPRADWVEKIRSAFERYPEASGVGGAILDGSRGIAGRLEYLSNFSEYIASRKAGEVSTIPTINVAYRREAIQGIDFIPTTAGEDTTFNAEIGSRGGRLVFDPSISVTHTPSRRGLLSFFRNQYRCGKAFVYPRVRYPLRGQVFLRHPLLLLFMPRLAVLLARYLFTEHLVSFIVLLPLLAAGEVCRTAGVLHQRRVENS
ncbi:MAG: glycosyltransferase [Candidatus Aureabacteria bacterium]|nr:glycosyltransferase [Candidatus Auribacterota bacterium]